MQRPQHRPACCASVPHTSSQHHQGRLWHSRDRINRDGDRIPATAPSLKGSLVAALSSSWNPPSPNPRSNRAPEGIMWPHNEAFKHHHPGAGDIHKATS